jgi:hypothetical protein
MMTEAMSFAAWRRRKPFDSVLLSDISALLDELAAEESMRL